MTDGGDAEDVEARWLRAATQICGRWRNSDPERKRALERFNSEAERTDDPVRMYLREMGSVELLSREGEIAIAKRIEAGREAMIAGLCESPLTFQAVIIWRDELNEGKVLLRDIIDLEATYAGPDAKNVPRRRGAGGPRWPPLMNGPPPGPRRMPPLPPPPGAAAAAPPPDPVQAPNGQSRRREGRRSRRSPRPISTTRTTGKLHVARRDRGRAQAQGAGDLRQHRRRLQALRRLQDQDIENKLQNETLSPAQERKYTRS
jgi:RNA polymerase primary sigma factor